MEESRERLLKNEWREKVVNKLLQLVSQRFQNRQFNDAESEKAAYLAEMRRITDQEPNTVQAVIREINQETIATGHGVFVGD